MEESNSMELKKTIHFEDSGETLTIRVVVENASPERLKAIIGTLDVAYKELKSYFFCGVN